MCLNTFTKNLKKKRKEKGYTQRQLRIYFDNFKNIQILKKHLT